MGAAGLLSARLRPARQQDVAAMRGLCRFSSAGRASHS